MEAARETERYPRSIEELLGKVVEIPIGEKIVRARVVNGEEHFNEPSLSCGFVHFADPESGKKVTFAGTFWTLENAKVVG